MSILGVSKSNDNWKEAHSPCIEKEITCQFTCFSSTQVKAMEVNSANQIKYGTAPDRYYLPGSTCPGHQIIRSEKDWKT